MDKNFDEHPVLNRLEEMCFDLKIEQGFLCKKCGTQVVCWKDHWKNWKYCPYCGEEIIR